MSAGGAAPAIVTPARTVDRRTLADLCDAAQSALGATIRPGSPVGVWVDDPVDFAVAITAGTALRAQLFVVAAGATPARAAELSAIEGGAPLLCDALHAAKLPASDRRPGGPGLVLVETTRKASATYDDQGRDEGGAVHFYTSGTDGQPKGVVRTKESLDLEDATVGGHLGMAGGCSVLCAVPVTHGYGYTAGFFAPQSFGGTSIVVRPRMAASLAKVLAEHEPDIVVAVPAQYAAWAALRRPYRGRLPRLWLSGGAPMPAAVRARFKQAWGGEICEQYGVTECGAVSVDLDGTESLGRPYPGVEVFVDAADFPDGVGEVVVAAPYRPLRYVGDLAGDRTIPYTSRGFRTGDNGRLDAEGRLHLVGRRAHQLNVRGQKVDPAEVERTLWAVDGVRDVAVVGMDRAAGDQWVAAFVACSDEVTDDALHRSTANLDGYKRPQRLTRLPALPKTATGKTDVEALRALARSGPAGVPPAYRAGPETEAATR